VRFGTCTIRNGLCARNYGSVSGRRIFWEESSSPAGPPLCTSSATHWTQSRACGTTSEWRPRPPMSRRSFFLVLRVFFSRIISRSVRPSRPSCSYLFFQRRTVLREHSHSRAVGRLPSGWRFVDDPDLLSSFLPDAIAHISQPSEPGAIRPRWVKINS